MLIDLWSEETVQFALENSKTSKETREVYSTLQVNNTFFLIQFDHNMMHHLKDCEVTGLLIGTFVYKCCFTLLLNLLISCLFTVRFTKLLTNDLRSSFEIPEVRYELQVLQVTQA